MKDAQFQSPPANRNDSAISKLIRSDQMNHSPQESLGVTPIKKYSYRSEQKKNAKLSGSNQEMFDLSNDTLICLSDQEHFPSDHEEKMQEAKSNLSERVRKSQTQVQIGFQLTDAALNHIVRPKKSEGLGCECEFSRFFIAKKMGHGIELEEDARIMKNDRWTKTRCMITKDKLAFIEIFFQIKEISKLKIFAVENKTQEQIIKIQIGENAHFFSVDHKKKHHDLPLPFYMFSRLIMKKVDFTECSDWEKSEHIQKNVMVDSYIFGKIYKKSQHFGQWNERYVVIKRDGIYSYRDSNREQNYSFFISRSSVKYIWTRFDFTEKCLVLKIKHGLSKTQFGIPIVNYSCRSCRNWLYDFYRMLV